MVYYWLFFLYCQLVVCLAWSDGAVRRFPPGFMFGVASAAYQVEGGWDADGKGESMWDRSIHKRPDLISDGTSGDVSTDSYHNYKRDVEMLRELGVDFYRFSISWPRVFPDGFTNNKNEAGFQYYNNLIDELLKYNIEPMITMYHFDLPQKLQDLGGWANPLSILWFEDYARNLLERYGSKVKYWITFNQPNGICMEGYGDGTMAPFVSVKGIAEYICVKNVLLAHARVWKMFNEKYRVKNKGSLGISIAVNWLDPLNNATENVQATDEYREFTIGLYVNPIFSKTGDFPQVVKDIIARNSKEQGFRKSRLPVLTSDEISAIRGSADFLAMNHYTTSLVSRPKKNNHPSPSFEHDANVKLTYSKHWAVAKSPWLRSAPYGLYKALIYLNLKYDYPYIIITENGWSTDPGLDDTQRVDNLRSYLNALLLAIEDGAEVSGYAAWSLMDNFEWTAGLSERFGLYEVDFDAAEKTRTPRKSAFVYKEIIASRIVDEAFEPKSMQMTLSDRRMKMKAKIEL
ncbi:hypothetical protein JYU34_019513 [Plutella xylostella]|uniref:Myrosinase 1-like n=1 Tax=Plutella xylostella TaxID=51655 RepID=A0ABQ7PWY7_PLUXY|nr:hypothetical protein JYU34_019513 [Plutella xylostella]